MDATLQKYIDKLNALNFFTLGSWRISSRQESQVSPAVMRRSMEMEQESATAQREGEV